MIRQILLTVIVLGQALLVAAQGTATIIANDLVPSTVISGGFGVDRGEFGAINPNEAEALGLAHYPVSLAVDSKGNIYILDVFNNRIQKFDAKGRAVAVIPVKGLVDESGNPVLDVETNSIGRKSIRVKREFLSDDSRLKVPLIRGINIIIDSSDNLYYYSSKKDTGEVALFQNGKLKEKWSVPVADNTGAQLDENNDLWVAGFNASKRKRVARNASTLTFRDGRSLTLQKKTDEISLRFSKEGRDRVQKLKVERSDGYWISNSVKEIYAKNTIVNWGYFEKGARRAFLDTYTNDGELVSRSKLPAEINLRWNPIGPSGEIYQIVCGDAGLEVIKWSRSTAK